MDRKEFFEKSLKFGLCCSAFSAFLIDSHSAFAAADSTAVKQDEKKSIAEMERDFIGHWLEDLMNTINEVLDEKTKVKLIEGCGRGCFRRHQFKVDIANKGKDNLDKLIEAYENNFEIWREADKMHIRYGKESKMCYCPVAKFLPAKENDLHCECTRTTHQTIFETALGRPFKVEILESLRRGGKTCHFVVHLS